MRKSIQIVAIILLSITTLFAQQKAERIDLSGSKLDNFYRVDDGVYRSNQPSGKDFELLEKFGIREVLNLRNWHNDTAEARKTALKLHRISSRATTISQPEIIASLRIITQRQGPIVVHCWHGSDRTGAVIAMYRIVIQGWTKAAAIDEMVNGGFGFHKQYSQIIDMINQADIEQIKMGIDVKLTQKEQ